MSTGGFDSLREKTATILITLGWDINYITLEEAATSLGSFSDEDKELCCNSIRTTQIYIEQRNIVPSIDVRLVNILMRANLIAGNRGLSLYSMDQTSLNRRNWSDVEYNAALCFLRHRGRISKEELIRLEDHQTFITSRESKKFDILCHWLSKSFPSWKIVGAIDIASLGNKRLPLVGREDAMIAAYEIFKARLTAYRGTTEERTDFPVCFVGAASGMGKSRILREFGPFLENLLLGVKKNHNVCWVKSIYMTYSSTQYPLTTRELADDVNDEASFSLRLMFNALRPPNSITFQEFLDMVTPEVLAAIDPITVMKVLSDFHGGNDLPSVERPGLIYLAVDELNFLNENKLKGMLGQLSTINSVRGNVILFPIMASNHFLPFEKSVQYSGLEFSSLPIATLSYASLRLLMEKHVARLTEEVMQNHYKQWETCRAFLEVLYKFGTHPRFLSKLIKRVDSDVRVLPITKVEFDLYDSYMASYVEALSNDQLLTDAVRIKLVSDYVLRSNIHRLTVLDGTITYETLEKSGVVFLETGMIDKNVYLNLPFSVLYALIEKCTGIPAFVCLRLALKEIRTGGIPHWNGFEKFCVNFEACRELLCREIHDQSDLVSLVDFYGHSAQYANNVQLLNLKVSSKVEVIKREKLLATEFPPVATDYIAITAVSDVCDIFRIREDEYGIKWFIAGQMKYYMESTLSHVDICNEVEKVKKALCDTQFKASFVVVIVAANAEFQSVPQNCVVLNGNSLMELFSPDVSMQAFPFIQWEKINVNTASKDTLALMVPCVGKVTAQLIETVRKSGRFSNWDDLCNRIPRIRDYSTDATKNILRYNGEEQSGMVTPKVNLSQSAPTTPAERSAPAESSAPVSKPRYLGQGKVCFCNSIVQIFYHIPAFRAIVLRWIDLGVDEPAVFSNFKDGDVGEAQIHACMRELKRVFNDLADCKSGNTSELVRKTFQEVAAGEFLDVMNAIFHIAKFFFGHFCSEMFEFRVSTVITFDDPLIAPYEEKSTVVNVLYGLSDLNSYFGDSESGTFSIGLENPTTASGRRVLVVTFPKYLFILIDQDVSVVETLNLTSGMHSTDFELTGFVALRNVPGLYPHFISSVKVDDIWWKFDDLDVSAETMFKCLEGGKFRIVMAVYCQTRDVMQISFVEGQKKRKRYGEEHKGDSDEDDDDVEDIAGVPMEHGEDPTIAEATDEPSNAPNFVPEGAEVPKVADAEPDAPVPDAPVPDAPVPDAPVPDAPEPEAPDAPVPRPSPQSGRAKRKSHKLYEP